MGSNRLLGSNGLLPKKLEGLHSCGGNEGGKRREEEERIDVREFGLVKSEGTQDRILGEEARGCEDEEDEEL